MATDPDQTTILSYLAALLFGGGGAARLVTHEGRIKSLESSRTKHSDKLEEIHGLVSRLDERSEGAERDRQEILRLLRDRS